MDQDTPTNTGFGASTASDTGSGSITGIGGGTCAHCGQPLNQNRGLEQFLGRLGISDEMISNLRASMQNVDVEEYLNTARDYLKTTGDKLKNSSGKAADYAKENPGKVAAGVAVLAVGAGLLLSSLNRDK